MPPKRKVTVACKAMKSIGFPENEVKPVLNQLLESSDYNWGYIENDEYRALIEALLQKKPEQEKVNLIGLYYIFCSICSAKSIVLIY